MRVLLVHGLARSPLSLAILAERLRRAGHRPQFFGYLPLAESYAHVLRRLVRRLRGLAADGEPVGLVGHSLGGLLLRHALPFVPNLHVHHLVMLGVPNQPPRLAPRAWRSALFRMLTRSCGEVVPRISR